MIEIHDGYVWRIFNYALTKSNLADTQIRKIYR